MLLPLHGILLLSIRNSEQMPELCAYWTLPFRYALVTFAPVSTNAIISPLSLHARWSLKLWHQPIVPFPSVAIPLNTLAYLLRLWHTGIIVESTNVMPVHLPKAPRLRKNMSWNNTRLSNSTKRLYDTAFGK